MKTTVVESNKGNNNNNVTTGKVNGLPVGNGFTDKKEEPKKEEAKPEAPKAEEAKPQAQVEPAKTEPAKAEQAQPQTEPNKKELKESFAVQQAQRLENTVKLVEQLGKKIAQKNKLQNTIGNLDSFTVTQNDDKDDMASDSRFARCELVISDDDGNEFVTKNPFIIAYVAQEVKQLCIDKLAEVEASIVIPL
jgi:chemotaxis protein histidine kinase CheA